MATSLVGNPPESGTKTAFNNRWNMTTDNNGNEQDGWTIVKDMVRNNFPIWGCFTGGDARRSERRVAGHTSEGQRSSAPVKRAKIGKLFLTMSLLRHCDLQGKALLAVRQLDLIQVDGSNGVAVNHIAFAEFESACIHDISALLADKHA